MNTKYIQLGRSLDYKNAGEAKINVGDAVVFGTKVFIASTDIAVGETGTLATTGVYECDKDNSDVKKGAKVYYDKTNEKVTTTSTSNTEMGIAIEDAGTTVTKVKVKID